MVERSMAEAAEAMHGRIVAGGPELRFRGAAIDSRSTSVGNLFFALEGERTDGHRFTGDALARGAVGVVVHQDPGETATGVWVRVDDTLRALHDLTRHVRETVPQQLVAITGSVGKTTTKELLAAMLARRFRTARSPGNLNNLYGFPLSLLGIDDDSEWLVAEMGMSTPGELRAVSQLGRPDVAVFTNIRPAHLANFADLDAIADAKAGLLAGLPPDGLMVANADDPRVLAIAARHAGPVVRYGFGRHDKVGPGTARPDLDMALYDLASPAEGGVGSRFVLKADGECVTVELPLHGLYNAENCLAAAAAAHALGVSLDEIAAAVRSVQPAAMRGVVESLVGGVQLVDDAYNANPAAVARALESAALLAGDRYVAVLGDMLELGPTSPELHREVGRAAASAGFALVVGVGPLAEHTVAAAAESGLATRHFADAAAAAAWAVSADGPAAGDVVLVKGSRGVALEAVTEALRRRARRQAS